MEAFTVITENDESQWSDETGKLYHYPSRYRKLLQPGTKLIYYKGRMRDRAFAASRLSEQPHYFATAVVGESRRDPQSTKGDYFADIVGYQRFEAPVLAKLSEGDFLEQIPDSRQINYWRDGVRGIDQETYEKICSLAGVTATSPKFEVNDEYQGELVALESGVDGQKGQRFSTFYERDPALRRRAIEIHGVRCACCKMSFLETYGEHGEGYIHIHHLNPVSEQDGPTIVRPQEDMAPVCPNCHAMIHRRRNKTLSIEELRSMIDARRKAD